MKKSYQLARYTDMKELWPGALKWKNYGQVHWNERFWSWSCWCIFLSYCLMGISKIELDKYIWVRNCNRGLLCILCNYMSLRPRKLSFVVLLFQGALEGSTGIRLLSKWKKRQCRGTFLFNEEIQKILPFRATRPFDEWNISQYAAFKYLFKDLEISAEKTQQRHLADYPVPLLEENVAPWWEIGRSISF